MQHFPCQASGQFIAISRYKQSIRAKEVGSGGAEGTAANTDFRIQLMATETLTAKIIKITYRQTEIEIGKHHM